MKKSRNQVKNRRLEKSHLEKELKICMAKLKVLLDNISKGRQYNLGRDVLAANI